MAESDREATTLGAALRRYISARDAAMLAARRTLGISDVDARALLYVVDNPGARARDLGDHLGASSAGITTLTDRLVSRGVIRRDPDAADRRIVRLTATVDLEDEPWSVLRGFDTALAAAVDADDPEATGAAGALLDRLTRTAAAG